MHLIAVMDSVFASNEAVTEESRNVRRRLALVTKVLGACGPFMASNATIYTIVRFSFGSFPYLWAVVLSALLVVAIGIVVAIIIWLPPPKADLGSSKRSSKSGSKAIVASKGQVVNSDNQCSKE